MPSSMTTFTLSLLLALGADPPATPPTDPDQPSGRLDLQTAMADPAWLGAYPERVRWTAGGDLVFDRRVGTSEERQTILIDPDTSEERTLSLEEQVGLLAAGRWNRDRDRMAIVRDGDIVIMDDTGTALQLTRTTSRESTPRWLTDGRLAFTRDGGLVVRDLDSGIETEPIRIQFADPPKAPDAPQGLAADQRRLFEVLRENADRREADRLRRRDVRDAMKHDVVGPVHLPPDERESARHLSPDGRWMLLELSPRNRPDARRDDMAIWVTDDGYVTGQPLRPKVGTRERTSERLVLLDLQSGESHDVSLDDLPERRLDRLAGIREENRTWLEREASKDATDESTGATTDADEDRGSPSTLVADLARAATDADRAESASPEIEPRPISITRVAWHPDGAMVAVTARSLDNKDRWIAAIDPRSLVADEAEATAAATDSDSVEEQGSEDPDAATPTPSVTLVEHQFDPGWINWSFNEMDWTNDGAMLWFLSEDSGWSDLRGWSPGSDPKALVAGSFEIRNVQEHPADGTLLFRSNRDDPSAWRLERYDPGSGWSETIAGGDGMIESFTIAPDGSAVAYTESFIDHPAELNMVELPDAGDPAAIPRRLTNSASERFAGVDWRPPTLVDVPGRHGRDIRGRLHLPPPEAPVLPDGLRPAILFVHGAGYLQNAHAGWSRYFREGFFHDLLAREGFVVLDLDYRASSGYGSEWRTAIARDMGRCELDDYEDGIAWLAEHHAVDPERIGIYGGSYGGFTALMGLFTRPGVFKAGAALRPVTDWTYYNDGYTANILNRPQDDPLAYRRSSPIEHAEGLEDALLICHGMVDANVPYSDSVRLAQRLIELGKVDWELAGYPIEGHGFRETSSWIDEYHRIRRLFRMNLLGDRSKTSTNPRPDRGRR